MHFKYKLIKNAKEKILTGGFKLIIPAIYLFLLCMSLLISLLSIVYPPFELCPGVFEQRICAPVGVYLGLFISFPGYILVGSLLSFSANLAWGVSLIVVILTSVGFYFLIGLFLDSYKVRTPRNRLKLLVWTVFAVLIILFLFLASQATS